MAEKHYQCLTLDIPIISNQVDYPIISNQPDIPILDSDETEKSKLNANANNSRSKRNTDFSLDPLIPVAGTFSNSSGRFYSLTTSVPNLSTLNCSSTNVHCGEIICDVSALSSDRDNARLRLQFSMNLSKLMEDDALNNDQITEFITEAWVDIVHPVNWTVLETG